MIERVSEQVSDPNHNKDIMARKHIPFLFACGIYGAGDSVYAEIAWNGKTLAALPPNKEYDFRFVLWDADVFACEVGD